MDQVGANCELIATRGTEIGICNSLLQSSRTWAVNRARPGASSPSFPTPTVLALQISGENPLPPPRLSIPPPSRSTAGLLARNPLRTGHLGREKCCLVQKNGQKSQHFCWCHACCRTRSCAPRAMLKIRTRGSRELWPRCIQKHARFAPSGGGEF